MKRATSSNAGCRGARGGAGRARTGTGLRPPAPAPRASPRNFAGAGAATRAGAPGTERGPAGALTCGALRAGAGQRRQLQPQEQAEGERGEAPHPGGGGRLSPFPRAPRPGLQRARGGPASPARPGLGAPLGARAGSAGLREPARLRSEARRGAD